jgi:hypothetical protein
VGLRRHRRAQRFHDALARQDGRTACAQLNAETVSRLEREEGTSCEEAVVGLELPRQGTAGEAVVYVRSASVELAGGSTTFLDEGPQGWRVSAAGCTPSAPEQPYECELES